MEVDVENLHDANILRWPRRWREDILGRPVDELGGPPPIAAEAVVIEMSFELRDDIAGGLHGSLAGGVVVPELETRGLRSTRTRCETFVLRITRPVEGFGVDVRVPVNN